jgi:hypothetical protein
METLHLIIHYFKSHLPNFPPIKLGWFNKELVNKKVKIYNRTPSLSVIDTYFSDEFTPLRYHCALMYSFNCGLTMHF